MKLEILEKATVRYPSHVFPWHVHPDHHCLSLVTAGSAVLDVAQQQVVVEPGDLVFIPAGMPHRTTVPHSFSYQIIRFRERSQTAPLAFRCLIDSASVGYFCEWFDRVGDEASTKTILSILHFSSSETDTGRSKDAAVLRCLEHMHEHYSERLSLDELSRIALRSSSHLLRTFRAQVGISPARYLMGLKIDRAKALIQSGHTLVDTALGTGFYDQSHFSRHFKQLAGLSPKAYQTLILE